MQKIDFGSTYPITVSSVRIQNDWKMEPKSWACRSKGRTASFDGNREVKSWTFH